MSAPDVTVHTMRVGVFSNLHQADKAVARLLGIGFHPDNLTVVCSGEVKENYFRTLREAPADHTAKGEVTSGATMGAAIGGLSAIALGVVTGAVPLIVAGVAGVAGGGALGGFVGVMTSQEVENDFLNACHEQVLAGKILVAAEDHTQDAFSKLASASRIFIEEGSEMNTLPEP